MKKKMLLFGLSLSILVACNGSGESENDKSAGEDITESVNTSDNTGINAMVPDSAELANAAVPQVTEDTYEFGVIKEGEKVTHSFEVENTGASPLIISDVRVGCGCTTPKFDNKPIKPGDRSTIEIGFNSAGQKGKQHKIITVITNGQPAHTLLHLKGEVQ